MPAEGTLRVWNIINPPNPPQLYDVEHVEQAAGLINSLAEKQLRMDWIGCNVFGLEIFEDGEWCEWYSGDGDSIDDLLDRTEEE